MILVLIVSLMLADVVVLALSSRALKPEWQVSTSMTATFTGLKGGTLKTRSIVSDFARATVADDQTENSGGLRCKSSESAKPMSRASFTAWVALPRTRARVTMLGR
jgi:hypothetical protein